MGIDQSVLDILQVLRAITAAGICGVLAWFFFRVIKSPGSAALPFLAFLFSFALGAAILRFFVGGADGGGVSLAHCDDSTYPNIIMCNGWPLYLDTAKQGMETIMSLGGHNGGAAVQSGLMSTVTLLALYMSLAKNIWKGTGRLVLEAFLLGAMTWIVLANAGWLMEVTNSAVTYGVTTIGESQILSSISEKLTAYNSAIGVAERVTDFATIGELETTKKISGSATVIIYCFIGFFNLLTIINTLIVSLLVILTNYLPSIALLMMIMGSYSPGAIVRLIGYAAIFKIALFIEYGLLYYLPSVGDDPIAMVMQLGWILFLTWLIIAALLAVKFVMILKFIHFIYKRELLPIRSGFRILTRSKA